MNKDLLLTTEQLNEIVWTNTDKEKQTYALGTIIQQVAQAELNHLAELGTIYVRVDKYIPMCSLYSKDITDESSDRCLANRVICNARDTCRDYVEPYIPLLEYIEEE